MEKEKINYGEMAGFFRQLKKHYKFCEHSEEMMNVIVEKDSILSALRSEEKMLNSNMTHGKLVLKELQTKIASARKEINICNTEIVGKVQKTKEELEYYQSEVSGVKTELESAKTELESVKGEANNLNNQVVGHRKELVNIEKNRVDIENKTKNAKVKLKEVKDSLVVTD